MGIPLYTFYTPSHEFLYENWLYPSATKSGFSVCGKKYEEQMCPTANYATSGWRYTQYQKIKYYLDCLKKHNSSDVVVCCDVDINFIRKCGAQVLSFLGGYDIAFQQNIKGEVCSGFFVARCSLNTINFFEAVKLLLEKKLLESDVGGGEQYVIWSLLKSNKHNASVGFLPSQLIWNPRGKYNSVYDLKIPKNIMVHHANWVDGMDNKIDQLNYVVEYLNEFE